MSSFRSPLYENGYCTVESNSSLFSPVCYLNVPPAAGQASRSMRDQTKERTPCSPAKRSRTHVEGPAVYGQSSVDYGNTKITQHALKVSESS